MPSEFGEPWSEKRLDKDWKAESSLDYYFWPIINKNGTEVVSEHVRSFSPRIVACVNFLRAIPTEILQAFPNGADRVALLACQEYVERRKLNITGDQA